MSGSMEVPFTSGENYQDVFEWVKGAGPEKLADLNIALVAAQSMQGSQVSSEVPGHLEGLIRKIGEMGPELRPHAVAKIAAKIQELSKPTFGGAESGAPQAGEGMAVDEPAKGRKRTLDVDSDSSSKEILEPPLKQPKKTFIPEGASTTPPEDLSQLETMSQLPLQNVMSFLDQKSEVALVQVSRTLQSTIRREWVANHEPFRSHEGLQELLPSFLSDPPLKGMPIDQQYVRWEALLREGGELTGVVTTSLDAVLKSSILTRKEKTVFLGKSVQDVISNPELLHLLLKTDYDRNLVIFSSGTWNEPMNRLIPDLSQCHTLNEKALVARDHFQQHRADISGIYCNGRMLTCIPREIFLLAGLRLLNLDDNQLKVLPKAIGSLRTLVSLSLSKNQLQSLPDSIGSLLALKGLLLSNNQLQSLPESIGSLAIMDLHLHLNQLKSLPKSFGAFKNLQRLRLDGSLLQSDRVTIESLKSRGVKVSLWFTRKKTVT